jgi:hypothetical protein
MNSIQHLLDQLRDTDAIYDQLERAVDDPNDEIYRINADALKKRRADLERRLSTELRISQADLVHYHVQRTEVDHYPVIAIAKAISSFQEVVTSVFDAIRTTPKQRYRPAAENVALSTLGFSMALPVGSVVVSMSVENDRLLAVKSDLDIAFDRVFQLLRTEDPEELRVLAPIVGIASIAKAHDWAENAAGFGFDTRITLEKDFATETALAITKEEALTLKEAIEQKSEQTVTPEEVVGELVGIDVLRPTTYFHIAVDGRNIEGKLADTFPADKEWAVHILYRAKLLQVETIRYSTGEAKIDWLLADLIDLKLENSAQLSN